MKSKLRIRILAFVTVILLSLTSTPSLASDFSESQGTNTISAMEAVEALYILDGEPLMIEHMSDDQTCATYTKDAAAWAKAYDILPDQFIPEDALTRADAAVMLYHYAQHHDIDVTCTSAAALYLDNGEESDAILWALNSGIISADIDNGFHADELITRSGLLELLDRYQQADLDTVGITADGLTLMYPSENMLKISPLCDFYVIGDISDTVEVPDNALLTVSVTNKDGDLVRQVYTNIKDNQEGMNVDYPGIDITGDREAFRASLMPDLVYAPANPESFNDTWIKAYYTDEHYTSLIYGGSYHQDINPVDQFGQTLHPIPEGDYNLSVTLTSGDETIASLSVQITIGVIQRKAITRFSPDFYKKYVQEYCAQRGIVVFNDPYPGYWNTKGFMPDWGSDYTGEILDRWVLVDRQGYIGGMTCLFDYNISKSSTSYRVELGQLGYDRVLDDRDSIAYYYYDIGEPFIKQHGKVYEGTFVRKNLENMNPVMFTRADHSTVETPENFISPAILENTTSEFDLGNLFTVYPGETVSLNGVCRVIQPETVTFLPETQSFELGNRIAGIRYTIKNADGSLREVIEKEVPGLQREFEDGSASTSILEFRHNFDVTEDMRGYHIRIFAEALDESGNVVDGLLFGCQFKVPRY